MASEILISNGTPQAFSSITARLKSNLLIQARIIDAIEQLWLRQYSFIMQQKVAHQISQMGNVK